MSETAGSVAPSGLSDAPTFIPGAHAPGYRLPPLWGCGIETPTHTRPASCVPIPIPAARPERKLAGRSPAGLR